MKTLSETVDRVNDSFKSVWKNKCDKLFINTSVCLHLQVVTFTVRTLCDKTFLQGVKPDNITTASLCHYQQIKALYGFIFCTLMSVHHKDLCPCVLSTLSSLLPLRNSHFNTLYLYSAPISSDSCYEIQRQIQAIVCVCVCVCVS